MVFSGQGSVNKCHGLHTSFHKEVKERNTLCNFGMQPRCVVSELQLVMISSSSGIYHRAVQASTMREDKTSNPEMNTDEEVDTTPEISEPV